MFLSTLTLNYGQHTGSKGNQSLCGQLICLCPFPFTGWLTKDDQFKNSVVWVNSGVGVEIHNEEHLLLLILTCSHKEQFYTRLRTTHCKNNYLIPVVLFLVYLVNVVITKTFFE